MSQRPANRPRRARSQFIAEKGGQVDPIDIQPSVSQKLLYSVIRESNPVTSIVAGYNNILTTRLNQVLGSHSVFGQADPFGRRSVYTIRATRYDIPKDVQSSYQASLTRQTLVTTIFAVVERHWIDAQGVPLTEKEQGEEFLLTNIPMMRGSIVDPIKSARERFEKGDDPLLPDGYFTLQGDVHYIVLYNKLKYDMPITFGGGDGEVKTSVICTTPDMSTVQIIINNTARYMMQCHTSILGSDVEKKTGAKGKYKMRFIRLYDYMAILLTTREKIDPLSNLPENYTYLDPDDDEITRMILSFVPEEHRAACIDILSLSAGHRPMLETIATVKSKIKLSDTSHDLERSMVEEIYPIIPYSNRRLKAHQLAYVASRHLLYMVGIHRPHDRDSPSIFRMDTPEIVITKLFADKLRAALEQMRGKNSENEATIMDLKPSAEVERLLQKPETPVQNLYKHISHSNLVNSLSKLKEDIVLGFNKGNFGGKNVRGPTKKFKAGVPTGEQKGIVARLETYSLSQAWSCLTKRGIMSSSKGKSIKVRSGHPGRVGYEDLFKSPDNEMIGLIMFLAATAYMSSWKDATPIILAIGTLPEESSRSHPHLILVNGIIKGYANGEELVRRLNILRQNDGPLSTFFDSMFFFDRSRQEVHILTDAGRLTRPLLTVEGRDLVIEKKKLWRADLQTLLREGALRYVDAYEAEYGSVIAQFPNYFRIRWNEIDQATEVLLTLKRERDAVLRGRAGEVTGVDIDRLLRTLQGYRIAYKKGVVPEVIQQVVTLPDLDYQISALERHIGRARVPLVNNYSEIDADAISGFSGGIIPFLNRNSGTKIAYGTHMNTQAVGTGSSNFVLGSTPILRLLNNGQRGLTETGMAPIVGTSVLPASQNVVVAISSGTAYGDYGGGGQEDAIQLNGDSVERGLLNYTVHKQLTYSAPAASGGVIRSSRPTGKDYTEDYNNLDLRGVVAKGSMVNEGDIIFSLEQQGVDGTWKRKNTKARPGERGIVTDVYYTANPLYIQVCLTEVRKPVPGTKFSSMHGNKGVVSEVTPGDQMPIDPKTGLSPDVIINPIGLPTRGTVGLTVEMVAGVASSLLGQRVNASGMDQDFRVEQVSNILEKAGLHPKGEFELLDRRTGKTFHSTVSMGIAQIQLIMKTIEESVNWTGRVDLHPWNMQPVKGKKRGGGIRMGVQELDTLIYHGAEEVRMSIYSRSSDGIIVPMCFTCGRVATASRQVGQYECTYCASTAPTSELHRARDIVKVQESGAWRHINQVLAMRGISVTHQLRRRETRE